ncbi:spore cortex biosynthesis protein YabQ [Ructibacterium gallinarum]|uniref:Spore cortex biosynthesis protein YabQ n=1 Tax=Ructibacterium gallinarum TaxID=2779355 RepID=A0A9D5M2F9_9FIRM|nr:spore cortex biosynthesis protein YabQ [Ructibacterium gallinarum]MBE5040253.1 spore cortex biosynthesis protein YabQ [Ructibacterium gallinarum]
MELSYHIGIAYFLWSLLAGSVLALLYDVLRAVRKMAGGSGFSVNTEDILFFLFAGIILFWMAFYKNGGQLRWQGFLGTVAGFIIYRCIFRDFITNAMIRFCGIFINILTWILKMVLLPLRLVYRIIKKPFVVVGWYTRQSAQKAEGAMRLRFERRKMRKKCRKAEKKKRLAEQKRKKQQNKEQYLSNPQQRKNKTR